MENKTKYSLIPVILLAVSLLSIVLLYDSLTVSLISMLLAGYCLKKFGGISRFTKDYFSAETLLPLFAGGIIAVFANSLYKENIGRLLNDGMMDFLIITMIWCSITCVNKKELFSISKKLLPAYGTSLIAMILLGVILSRLFGYSVLDGLYMTLLPTACGGSSGALITVPILYSGITNADIESYASRFIVFITLTNIISIIIATIIGISQKDQVKETSGAAVKGNGIHGAVVCSLIIIISKLFEKIFPFLNVYAWVALISVVIKIFVPLSDTVIRDSSSWKDFVGSYMLPGILYGVGVKYLDFNNIMKALDVRITLFICLWLILLILFSGAAGKLTGLSFVDSMLIIGCNMANFGGSGTLAVL
ncbi:MAG: 2-hydroxycarboxylate transporter family protein, partial [Erysipelotrichaceae bacterium]|nr:2-hydroxycarboxylate transporter family protein [Erysipelotrichaceae bacterium]